LRGYVIEQVTMHDCGCALSARARQNTPQEGGLTDYSPGGNGGGGGTPIPFANGPAAAFSPRIRMAKSNPRRTIIREWVMPARGKWQSAQQSSAFLKSHHERYRLPRSRPAPFDTT